LLPAQETQKSEEDVRRERAVAEFTRKMKDANYPALFEQAAKEFNVPSDILKAVAFAETRWEHLTWPPGENASPETGMPRPFGIMSLWDNSYFGHSLTEASALIGKDPEEVKRDPFQNIRAGAALMRKLYDETPRPDGSTEAQIESWRFAIRKYCGIPEPELNARHALDAYTFMSKGYHQYGVKWEGRPVNLEMIRAETRQIVAEEKVKKQLLAGTTNTSPTTAPASAGAVAHSNQAAAAGAPNPIVNAPPTPARERASKNWWYLASGVIVAAVACFLWARKSAKKG
jgi:hypothetical protein